MLLLLIALAQFSFAQKTTSAINDAVSNYQNHVSEIPFEFEGGMIVLKASFNHGQNIFNFILDSGAPTVITTDVLKTSSSRLISTDDMRDFIYNTHTVGHYEANDLVIGTKDFGSLELWSTDEINEMPALGNLADGGLIGANIMKGAIWMVDYQNKKILVTDKLENLPLENVRYRFPMSVTNEGSPMIKITWPGRKDQDAIVDLGCNQSLILPYRFLHDAVITQSLPKQEVKHLTTGLFSNETAIPSDTLAFIDIGTMRAESVYALFPKNNEKIIIGNAFLKNYTVVFDFIHHQLLLIPANQPTPDEILNASSLIHMH